jgi:hypothetical protein
VQRFSEKIMRPTMAAQKKAAFSRGFRNPRLAA